MTGAPRLRPGIVLRADASATIGTGHVMRVLAVAEALGERGCRCHLIAAALPESLAFRAGDAGVEVHRIEGPIGSPADLGATLQVASAIGAEAAVVDGYDFGTDWRAGLAAAMPAVAVFDDHGAGTPLHAAIVVNAAPDAGEINYSAVAPGARLLLGPAYAPLRREIREAAVATREPVERRKTLLLTFGGSDPLGLTAPCIGRLAPGLGTGERVVVVVGAADQRAEAVVAMAARFGDRVEVRRDVRDMGRLMAQARLAVSAAGTTTGELAALAVPAVLVVVAGNQELAADQVGRAGWCRVVDGRGEGAADRIAAAALPLWRDPAACRAMAVHIRGTVDAQGAVRIADAILHAIGRRGRDLTPP